METITPNIEIRSVVAQCLRTLTTSAENKDVITALQTLQSYLDEGSDSRIPSVQRAEFRRVHFTRTLRFLVSNIQADWVHSLKAQQRKELWDGLFLKGPADQTLLVLMEGVGELRSAGSDERHLYITVYFLIIFLIPPFALQTQHKFGPLGQHHGKVSSEWWTCWIAVVLLSGDRTLWFSSAPRDIAGSYCGTARPFGK